MYGYNRFVNGNYDGLVIDPNGVVCIEYWLGGCLKHEPVPMGDGGLLMVDSTTAICDRRRKYETTRYKLKHR
jgi:hypothetical protein